MHRERLERLVKVLEIIPDTKFNMHSWTCGTSACAAGWAAQDPELKSQGLKLINTDTPDGSRYPTYGDENGFEALARFFDISEDASWRLFDPEYYEDSIDDYGTQLFIPQSAVIERINELLHG